MFLFLDFETTGLSGTRDTVAEAALRLVDERTLRELDRVSVTVHVPQSRWDECNPKVLAMHRKSGLIARSLASPYTLADAERLLIEVVLRHDHKYRVLAGSSIHFDRRFIEFQMPELYALLFYRQFDVSSLYPLFFNIDGFPTHPVVKDEDKPHEADKDVEASINITRYYKEKVTLHFRSWLAAHRWAVAVKAHEANQGEFTFDAVTEALRELRKVHGLS